MADMQAEAVVAVRQAGAVRRVVRQCTQVCQCRVRNLVVAGRV